MSTDVVIQAFAPTSTPRATSTPSQSETEPYQGGRVRCRISGSPTRPSPLEATARRSAGRSPSESSPAAGNGKAVQ